MWKAIHYYSCPVQKNLGTVRNTLGELEFGARTRTVSSARGQQGQRLCLEAAAGWLQQEE